MNLVEPAHLMRMILISIVFVNASCSSEKQVAANDEAETNCEQGKVFVDGECVAKVLPDLDSGWTRIEPGGETVCTRGDPYSFFVHPGTVNKLLVFFAFGGFCYNADLCRDGAINHVPTVKIDEAQLSSTSGIFDVSNSENPFREWYMVYVPECTADFAWGDNVVDYPATDTAPAITIRHKGFVNASAAREWIYDNFNAPEQIAVLGSSGGGNAALMHSAYLREHYGNTQSKSIYLADSSAGVTTREFITEEGLPKWGAFKNRPMWIPAIADASIEDLSWDMLTIEGGKFYSDATFAEFVSAYDPFQSITYQIMGGVFADWHDKMEAHIQNVSENLPDNFRYFVVGGEAHMILETQAFYGHQVDGTRFVNWITDLVNGIDVPNMHCTECETETLLYE